MLPFLLISCTASAEEIGNYIELVLEGVKYEIADGLLWLEIAFLVVLDIFRTGFYWYWADKSLSFNKRINKENMSQWWARLRFGNRDRIETFRILITFSRLGSRLLKNQSLFRDWDRDFQNTNPFFETGIETFKIPIRFSRLGSRLSKCQSPFRD